MAISKLFLLSIILVAFTFSANITPASASSRRLQFFPPGFPFPFGGSSPSDDGSSPSSGYWFPSFPPFHFFSGPVGNGMPGGTPADSTPPANVTPVPGDVTPPAGDVTPPAGDVTPPQTPATVAPTPTPTP